MRYRYPQLLPVQTHHQYQLTVQMLDKGGLFEAHLEAGSYEEHEFWLLLKEQKATNDG